MGKRLAVYHDFCESQRMVLFATDIASRGLDFPFLDWVIQVDCPKNINQYIHRVGRTARYTKAGRALMMILPSEKVGMLCRLNDSNLPIKLIHIDYNKITFVTNKLQVLLAKNNKLKKMAHFAVISYIKSAKFVKNTNIYKISELPFTDLAISMGLSS